MDAITTHVLSKLDQIREHQIKEGAALDEIRHLLRSQPASPVETVATMVAQPVEEQSSLALVRKLLSMNSLMWLSRALLKHAPILLTILYMKATGQDEKILLYVNGLLGI